jgi:phospholipid/cholesterol/gamma-HCH transport system permease protein
LTDTKAKGPFAGMGWPMGGPRRTPGPKDHAAVLAGEVGLSAVDLPDRLKLVASGAWTAVNAAPLSALTDDILDQRPAGRRLDIDTAGIEKLDTFGAWLLERLERRAAAQGWNVHVTGVSEHFTGLLHEVRKSNQAAESAAPRPSRIRQWLELIGREAEEIVRDIGAITSLLGACGASLAAAIRRPGSFRLTSTIHHVDRSAWQAVPIILLITFLIGGIIAQQGFFHFRKFGAEDYVVDLVGVLVLREIGVLLVAIMVAGRSGSAYTAELGSMKMREEIDALRTMGRDPVEVLILPRVLALVVAMPVLTFIGSMAALVGGGLIAWTYAGMHPEMFIARLEETISTTHFQVGMIKAPFIALLIGLVACNEGLKVKGSAESLGLHTTTSVVKSIFLVIVLDGFFAIFFSSIGM